MNAAVVKSGERAKEILVHQARQADRERRRHFLSRNVVILLVLAVLFTLFPRSVAAEELPAGTTLEVRLSDATGSRVSHVGDRVEGTVIAPALLQERVLIPQGVTITGVVASVERLGLGLKHLTAAIEYRFDTLRLPDGKLIPIETKLINVETAKERVNVDGRVGGIHPTASLSSSVSIYVLPFLYAAPLVAGPTLAIKVLIARSPDPEIYFPRGTEFILQLTAAVDINRPDNRTMSVASLQPVEITHARQLIDSLPQSHAREESGRPSDLVNILFLGSREQINRAFHAAGWSSAHRKSAMSIYRMYHSLVQRVGYSKAPMQALTLNRKSEDATFQKSLDTFSKRHHVRLWKQQQSDFWLSAATEDVGYKLRGLRLTHATDLRIDTEREKVINDLTFTGCLDAASRLSRGSPLTDGKSQGSIVTDGNIAVVRLNDCRNPRAMSGVTANPRPAKRRWFVRGLLALRSDIIRSNPIFLGYSTIRLVSAKKNSKTERIQAALAE